MPGYSWTASCRRGDGITGTQRSSTPQLAAMPESTGLALSALSGLADKQDVSHSIIGLKDTVKTLTTPFSLGWAILGLSAWGERPRDANAMIDRCLRKQNRYGAYDTSLISLMIDRPPAMGMTEVL